MTSDEIKGRADTLRQELATIQTDLDRARGELHLLASKPGNGAEQAATRIMVLEARQRATQANVEAAEKELARNAELVKSKAYGAAQQRMREIENELAKLADGAQEKLTQVRKDIAKGIELERELSQLVSTYGVEMDAVGKIGRIGNPDNAFLTAISRQIEQAFYFKWHDKAVARRAGSRGA
jgi:chromosome segregation ATPase